MNGLPSLGEKVFIATGDHRACAYFAFGEISSQLNAYIAGYEKAAQDLIETALKESTSRSKNIYVFPSVFLYRQYIELAQKNIYLMFSRDSKPEKIQTIKDCMHNLGKMWKVIRPIIEEYFPDDDPGIIDSAETYILEMSSEDERSVDYRYPFTMALSPVHGQSKCINLENFRDRMTELGSFFSGVTLKMQEYSGFEDERAYEAFQADLNMQYEYLRLMGVDE